MHSYSLGLMFAGGTVVCWTFCAAAFSSASRTVGSLPVNVIRLALASVFFALHGGIVRGHFFPLDASAHAWFWLSVSGFVGFFLGDLFFFRSFRELGVRLSMLIMSLAPLIAAVTGWFWLGERITPREMAGMAITLLGVIWVVLERRIDDAGNRNRISARGVMFAILGAAGQGIGLVMGKEGMTERGTGVIDAAQSAMYDSFAATQIRAFSGLAAFLVLTLFLRRTDKVLLVFRHPKALSLTLFGALIGTFLGVALLMRSVQTIPTGIAQTLVATVPVFIIPLAMVTEKERVTWRALWGTLAAVGGVAMLCL